MHPQTPAPVVSHAADAINESLRTPETREIFAKFPMETIPSSPKRVAALIASELTAWGDDHQGLGLQRRGLKI
jgi:tripartite-type tricarboxylate transporter receptor subunit TctC